METSTSEQGLARVIITGELNRRAWRAPDYEAENKALVALAQHVADSPDSILQNLAETTLKLCRAGSSGISIVEDNATIFRWHALAGALGPHRWGTTPRKFSPCGTVLDHNAVELMFYPELHFTYFAEVKPTIVEALLVPFEVEGKTIGTLWAVSHDELRKFDAEDDRVIRNLAKFAAAAYQVRSALDAVREADRRKDEFLAMLGHELRNPLFPLQNAIEFLIKTESDKPESQQAQGIIQRQLALMRRLIDDLMDASRITQGKIELRKERVELKTAVQSAIEASLPLIESRRHQLDVALPPESLYIDADPSRLEQILTNLLTNAARYTKEGGWIGVSAHVESSEIAIRIKDNGIGIPADKLASIFELFSQLDKSVERSHGGLGIGLTLVMSLAKLHGGTVEALSAGIGKGSEFIVRLPLHRVQDAHSALQPRVPKDADVNAPPRLRILVADDNRDAADSLSLLLRMIGHDVWTVYDGPSTLDRAIECKPNVVLHDIGLPGMNGYEVARRLREHESTKDALLVAVTGYANEENQERSRKAGFDHHLIKPVDFNALEQLLKSAYAR